MKIKITKVATMMSTTIIVLLIVLVANVIIKLELVLNAMSRLNHQVGLYEYYIEYLTNEKQLLEHQVEQMNNQLEIQKQLYEEMQKQKAELENTLNTYSEVVPNELLSRGSRPKPVVMEVTAYDLSYASCQKYPSDPYYGITASGKRVKEWHTVAAGKDIPFGTKIFIPFFADKPNKGIFTVEDRGGAITKGKLDVYMKSGDEARQFGRRKLEVYILN